MPLLTLNGITINCDADAGAAKTTVYLGGTGGRAAGGQYRGAARATRREWSFTTGPLSLQESEAVQGLVEGRGQHMPFNADTAAESGLMPSTSVFPTSMGAGYQPAHPHNPMWQIPSYDGQVQWTVGSSSAWSLICSTYINRGLGYSWLRLLFMSGGDLFINGTQYFTHDLYGQWEYLPSTGILTWRNKLAGGTDWTANTVKAVGNRTRITPNGYMVTAVTGTAKTGASQPVWNTGYLSTTPDNEVTWTCIADSGGYGFVGDLAWVPYKLPSSWVPQVEAFHAAAPWSPLPALVAGGTFHGGAGTLTVLGEVEGVKSIDFMSGGALTSGELVTFTLREA